MLLRNGRLSTVTALGGTLLFSALTTSALAVVPAPSATAATTRTSEATAIAENTAPGNPSWPASVCRGTARKPGVLAGSYWNVVVRGVCVVNRGPALVRHDVIVARNSSLLAAYGRWYSRLVVTGNVVALSGATAVLGCEPKAFPCLDDPHPGKPTLASHDAIGGSLVALGALGVVVHASKIGGSVLQAGGGGGLACKPTGIFATFNSPVYSDYEDDWIGGNVLVKGLRSCWLGVIRDWVGVSATISRNVMADPDAMEVVSNFVHTDLTCWQNAPKVQFGDSHGKPNLVGLHAYFECGFDVILPNPAGQHVHFSHISVPLRY